MPRRDSLLSRSLEPLAGLLWPLFFAWTGLIAILWVGGIGDASLSAIANQGLRDALGFLLRSADVVWLLLASANLYLTLAIREGLTRSRVWALAIIATSAAIAAVSVRTGWPLGSVTFTQRLGLKLGVVPLGWPLLWFVVVVGGREFAARLLPRASHAQLAAATGFLALLTSLNLEPAASKLRLFWFWYVGGTPTASQADWRNYATWALGTALLAFMLRERNVAVSTRPPAWRPALVLLLFNVVFLLANLRFVLWR